MEKKTKVRCYDLEGNMLQDFQSMKEASLKLSINENLISHCVSGRNNFSSSFQFRKLSTNMPKKIGAIYGSSAGRDNVPVIKYWGNKVVSVYNSISEAALNNCLSQGKISLSIKREKEANGFIFRAI